MKPDPHISDPVRLFFMRRLAGVSRQILEQKRNRLSNRELFIREEDCSILLLFPVVIDTYNHAFFDRQTCFLHDVCIDQMVVKMETN
ncbi:hypothetical protein JW948_13100 [bacterium]|nr:hypothetical protein [bacterium]